MVGLNNIDNMKKYFRFDDVCINADIDLINNMTDYILNNIVDAVVIYGISPLVHNMDDEVSSISKQRIFPKILNAYSDYRCFYSVDKMGIPVLSSKVMMASHGLIHVDHRLLTKECQEMSILISTSLIKSDIFIPPFNKYNNDTINICNEHNIKLIKFEDGWKCMEYNKYNKEHDKWYLHAREFTYTKFRNWFDEIKW